MSHELHPAAAQEHKQQVAYYENEQKGLGLRYHAEFKAAVGFACQMQLRPRVVCPPDIRSVSFKNFRFSIIYRVTAANVVQVLAVAHHRRQAGYWLGRV